MTHPAAFVPTTVAARELRKLHASLRLFVDDVQAGHVVDGPRTVTGRGVGDSFPASYDSQSRSVFLPNLYVDFGQWFHVASRRVYGGPVGTQDKWLRLVVSASYDLDDRYGAAPVNYSVATPAFDWADASGGTPTSEPGITAGSTFDYYFYLVRVSGERIVDKATSALFVGWPYTSAA